jgi:hypothetical protein
MDFLYAFLSFYISFKAFLNTFWGFLPVPSNREGPAAAHLLKLLYQTIFDLSCFFKIYTNASCIRGVMSALGEDSLSCIPGVRGAHRNFDGLVLDYNHSAIILF